MIRLPEFEPEDVVFHRFVRALRTALLGQPLRFTKAFRGLDSRKPLDVLVTGLPTRPRSVSVAEAVRVEDADAGSESSARVVWRWIGGQVRIEEIDLTSTSVEYDVRIVVEV